MALREAIREGIENGNKITIPMAWTFHRDRYFEPDGNGDFIFKTTCINGEAIPLFVLAFDKHHWNMNVEVGELGELPDGIGFEDVVFDLIANYEQDDRPFHIILEEWQNDPETKRC